MSEQTQITLAVAAIVVALGVLFVATSEPPTPEPVATPAAVVTPTRATAVRAAREAQFAEDEEHRDLRDAFATARAANDWERALAVAEQGVERFPDPSTEFGGHWLKQRNHLMRLMSSGR